MITIPIRAIPSQSFSTVIDNRNFVIALNQKSNGLFCDINVDGVDVSLAAIARNGVPLIKLDYSGQGNLLFVDMHGQSDPDYTGFDTRYFLVYMTGAELAQL